MGNHQAKLGFLLFNSGTNIKILKKLSLGKRSTNLSFTINKLLKAALKLQHRREMAKNGCSCPSCSSETSERGCYEQKTAGCSGRAGCPASFLPPSQVQVIEPWHSRLPSPPSSKWQQDTCHLTELCQHLPRQRSGPCASSAISCFCLSLFRLCFLLSKAFLSCLLRFPAKAVPIFASL